MMDGGKKLTNERDNEKTRKRESKNLRNEKGIQNNRKIVSLVPLCHLFLHNLGFKDVNESCG